MSIHEFRMTVYDVNGDDVDVTVHIESASYSAQTFDSPEESEIDFWFVDDEGNDVEVSDKEYDKITTKAWARLARFAEDAKADYEISNYESRRYEE